MYGHVSNITSSVNTVALVHQHLALAAQDCHDVEQRSRCTAVHTTAIIMIEPLIKAYYCSKRNEHD
jgi:hypothetical protein